MNPREPQPVSARRTSEEVRRALSTPHHHRAPRRLPVAAAVAALVVSAVILSACGDDDADVDSGDGPIAHPDGDALVLQIERTGGMRPPGAAFSDVPVATVLGDGTMIVEGAQIAIHPPPVLPPLFEMQLSGDGLQELLAAVDGAGLLSPPPDYGRPPIADARTTIISVHAGGRQVTHEIYALLEAPALGQGGRMPGLTDRQRERREVVSALVERITTPEDELVSPSEVSEPAPFEASRLAIRARPAQADDTPSGDVAPEVRDWPLPEISLAGAADCLEVDGAQADQLREVLTDANTSTMFRQDDTVYDLAVRPLLPHEDGCADVGGA